MQDRGLSEDLVRGDLRGKGENEIAQQKPVCTSIWPRFILNVMMVVLSLPRQHDGLDEFLDRGASALYPQKS